MFYSHRETETTQSNCYVKDIVQYLEMTVSRDISFINPFQDDWKRTNWRRQDSKLILFLGMRFYFVLKRTLNICCRS